MRKQWIPGHYSLPRGLGTRLVALPQIDIPKRDRQVRAYIARIDPSFKSSANIQLGECGALRSEREQVVSCIYRQHGSYVYTACF